MLTLIIAFMMISAHASDSWLCSEASSIKRGNQILACGLATARHEEDARTSALDHAFQEFQKVCELSSDCAGKALLIESKRTTCELDKNHNFHCARLIAFTIQENALENAQKSLIESKLHADDARLECSAGCNSMDRTGCWMPGAMYAWEHNCKE